MLKDPEGLEAFRDVDILMLQEVDPVADQIEELIAHSDFRLACIEKGVGLAILNRPTVTVLDYKLTLLQKTPAYQRWILQKFREHPLQTVGRGVLACRFATPDGNELTAVTGHANVPVKPIRRLKYINRLPGVMANIYGPAVLAGDMNHWPGPRGVDHRMVECAGLSRVDIGNKPTYVSAGSQHAWMGKLGINIEGQFDTMIYTPKLLHVIRQEVRDIPSDHRAIVTEFEFV